MMKKLVPWLIIVLVAITLITVAAIILWENVFKDPLSNDPLSQARQSVEGEEAQQLSAEERSELTVYIDKVTTNLSDINYMIQISFAFQLSNEKAKEEFELLTHLANSTIIRILSDTEPEDIRGSAGQDTLIAKLMNEINAFLQEGKISKVDITEFILTEL